MKTIILCGLIFIVSVMTNTITAKETKIRANKVPQLVKDGFTGKYHDAIIKKWVKNKTLYTVLFKEKNNTYESNFNSEGKWINTTSIIRWKDVPESVKTGFSESNYKDWIVYGLIKSNYSDGKTTYGMVVDNSNKYLSEEQDGGFTEIYKIYFSSQGKFISNLIQYNYNLL